MIPVVIIHLGNPHYLIPVINQALKNNTVYVLSDLSIPTVNNLISIPITNFYSKEMDHFSDIYYHLHNSSSRDYELFCYQRWFILLEFMNRFNFQTVMHIDSDVMFFVDAELEWKKFDQFIMTLSYGCSGATSYMTQFGLQSFIDMLNKIYTDKDYYFDMLVSKFDLMRKYNKSGGVCDMTLLDMFKTQSEYGSYGRIGEMMHIIDGSTYDHNINCTDQDFDMKNGIKNIRYDNNILCVYNNRLKRDIKFNSLHCQGNAKKYIHDIYNICNI